MMTTYKLRSFNHKDMIKLYAVFFILFLFSCKNKKEPNLTVKKEEISKIENNKKATKYYVTDCDSIPMRLMSFSNTLTREIHTVKTLLNNTPVYCSPSKQSKIVDYLGINKKLKIEKNCTRYYDSKTISKNGKQRTIYPMYNNWYKIDEGFILEDDIGFSLTKNVIISKKGSIIVSYNKDIIIDSLKLYSINMDSQTKIISSSTFLNNENNFKIITLISKYRCCPDGSSHSLIGVTNDHKLHKIVTGNFLSGEGDPDDDIIEKFYIPLKLGNGKVILVENGDFRTIFNSEDGTLNTFEYPKGIGVPIENLIVKEHPKGVIKYYNYKNHKLTQVKL